MNPWELTTARILIIDDDKDNLILLRRALGRAGMIHVDTVDDPFLAQEVYAKTHPDLVLLDLWLPPTDGFEVLASLRAVEIDGLAPPVIMITGGADEATKRRALDVGVTDFLSKEYDLTELLLRVRNALHTFQLYRQVEKQNEQLEEAVRERTAELFAARREVLERLAVAAEFRDDQTAQHTRRVGDLSAKIAQKLVGDKRFVESIGAAALLHDVGKIGISDSILLKPGPLDPQEIQEMQKHTIMGASILSGSNDPVLQMARSIALTHHEHFDGTGYPAGLARDEIPLAGRIVAAADAFDAMTNDRAYRAALPLNVAIEELNRCRETHFDSQVIDVLQELLISEGVAVHVLETAEANVRHR